MSHSSVHSQPYGDQNYHSPQRISGQQQQQHHSIDRHDRVLFQQQQQQQQQQEPRAAPRGTRRRDQSANASTGGDEAKVPSLDDYEAMLHQMTSPPLGPKIRNETNRTVEPSLDDFEAMLSQMTSPTATSKDSRSSASSANRRQDRESRDRAARPTRRQPRAQEQQQQQRSEQSQQRGLHPVNVHNTGATVEEKESFDQKKLRRRSSLPSKLMESPNLFASTKRLSSDHFSPGSPNIIVPIKENGTSAEQQQEQQKRYSWENESIAPRVDLLHSNNDNTRPDSLQRKNSWQDPDSEQMKQYVDPQVQQDISGPESYSPAPAIPTTTSGPPAINSATKPRKTKGSLAGSSPPQVRPITPNSRSRPSTPIGGIRPPPGPAPASVVTISSSQINGSPKLGKRSDSNGSNSGSLLQPSTLGSRARANSSASVNSLNGFMLDRVLTPPPPPTLPLPPPPPTSAHAVYQTPPTSQSIPVITGVGEPLQVIQGADGLPTPASSLSLSPELNATSSVANQTAHLARLKKRVSTLEKELANAEMELTNRIRDGSELLSKVERLTAERDSLETLRLELAEKNNEIAMLRSEQERSLNLRGLKDQDMNGALESMNQEIARLSGLQTTLEQELEEAKEEIQRLQELASNKDHENVREELEQQINTLLMEKVRYEEKQTAMEHEMESLQERLHQESAQYRTLQDSIQRQSSKMARLESQHANELQQLRMDHDDILEKTLQEHEGVMKELVNRHRADTDALVEHSQRQAQDSFRQERMEAEAREKVLRDRYDEKNVLYSQLEDEIFQLQNALEKAVKEKEALGRTNRSLERHISIQQLNEEENAYKLEVLQAENTRLRELLADLDIAAVTQKRIQRRKDQSEDGAENYEEEKEEETEEQRRLKAAEMFEEQQRKWNEQTQLMARKLARAEEEARKTAEQNESLRIALELAQSHSSRRPSTPTASSRVLSPPLSA
ncbi:hypothetical protein BGZ46_009554 [Entomortierella lignicola]|nr:hypothetical protein BGZ46_009554 [Entomortierella lignicola]